MLSADNERAMGRSVMHNLVTVCMWCRKTRTESGDWRPLDNTPVAGRFNITHGICPECSKKMFDDLQTHGRYAPPGV
jgi:hypothetical protein